MKPELTFCVLFWQMYQSLRKRESKTITKVKSYCLGRQQLQNYTISADESVILFVSGDIHSRLRYLFSLFSVDYVSNHKNYAE